MPSTRKVMPGFAFAAPGPAGGVGSLASRRSGQRPSRQRYYAPLRLPNVHRKVLRNPACSLLPVHSAFVAHEGSARRSGGPFRRGALVSRSTPTGVTPHCSALSQTGNDEALDHDFQTTFEAQSHPLPTCSAPLTTFVSSGRKALLLDWWLTFAQRGLSPPGLH